jgi:ATP phosphoribosyltransferase
MNEGEQRLSLAIQKSGRLTKPTIELLEGCDFTFTITDRVDVAQAKNFPMEIILSRSGDIPNTLIDDDVDLGIVGLDAIRESQVPLIELMPLGYEPCKMVLGVRQDVPYTGPASLEGKIVVTSYPNIAQQFFAENNVHVKLRTRRGSVEVVARRGKGSAVVDAMDSGESLRTNGLEQKEIIFESEAMLVANPALRQQTEKRKIVEDFLVRSLSYLRPKLYRWISMDVPRGLKEDILSILPSSLSPTVGVCEDDKVLDIASIIPTNQFWDITAELTRRGARNIAELAMKRLIPNSDDPQLAEMMLKIFG